MRLVNRRLMLQEPVSTIYSAWVPNSYVELFVFLGPVGSEDWDSIKLVDGVKTAMFLDPVFVASVPKFVPLAGDDECGDLYLIWEQADVNKLLARATAAAASAPREV